MRLSVFVRALILALFCCPLALAGDAALPSYHSIPCAIKCADSVAAIPIDEPRPYFPSELFGATYAEGFVEIDFTIGVDGRVHDPIVSWLLGPQVVADRALAAIGRWTFHPALLDGKPVEEIRSLIFDFGVRGVSPGARPSIAGKFNDAKSLLAKGNLDEALAELMEAQASPRLNYYERTMIAYVAALIYMQRKDYLSAADLLRLATIHDGQEIDPHLRISVLKLHIVDQIHLGQLGDAQVWLDKLKSVPGFPADDPIIKYFADIRAKADAMDRFPVRGRIPKPEDGAAWYHILYRRNFAFQNVMGTLERFQLRCRQASIESATSEKAEWHVPPDWSDCDVTVFGMPGTTFDLIESR